MKTGIHPQYHDEAKIVCACGNIVLAGSTRKEISTELCSACHPFYTGKQKLVDTAGKVDKFMARVKKAQEYKAKQVKKVDEEDTIEAQEEVKEVEKVLEDTTVAVKEEAPAKKKSPVKKAAASKKAPAKKKSPAKKASK